jgi:hypothetical protein
MIAIYGRRIRAQGVSATVRKLVDPSAVTLHALRLVTGKIDYPSNPYLASVDPAAELSFAAWLGGTSPESLRSYLAELEPLEQQLADAYAKGRPDAALHIGRFAIYHLVIRQTRPRTIVETGVHDGLSSAVILFALHLNGTGRLISIDLPSTDLPTGVDGPGWLVPTDLRNRWLLRLGDSRRHLPDVLNDHRPVHLFIHDSDHSREHQEFEFRTARPFMAPDGLMVSDQDYPFDPLLEELQAEWSAAHARIRTVEGTPGNFMGALRL